MAYSLSFTPVNSLISSPNKPGLLIGARASTAGKAILINNTVVFQSLSTDKSRYVTVKAGTDDNPGAKENSLVCARFDGRNDKQVRGFQRHIQTSFLGQFLVDKSFTGRKINRGCVVVASTLGRRDQKRETVIPDPDYRIPLVLLGVAGGLAYVDNLLASAPLGLLSLLLLFQTTRVRFVFDGEALEVKVGDELQESGENVFVGGKNRWKYSSFVNWELWWPNFPVLVYFKETQTKPEGQVHFFPVIFNGKQLYDTMVERAGPSKTSGPK